MPTSKRAAARSLPSPRASAASASATAANGTAAVARRAPTESSAPVVPMRPMARANCISLFEREVSERISRSALDLILARAETLSEGQCSERGGRDVFQGSTMLTIDLARVAGVFRDSCDAGTARRLAQVLGAEGTLPQRIRRLAEAEVSRICGKPPRVVDSELRVHSQGIRVFIDADVEASF